MHNPNPQQLKPSCFALQVVSLDLSAEYQRQPPPGLCLAIKSPETASWKSWWSQTRGIEHCFGGLDSTHWAPALLQSMAHWVQLREMQIASLAEVSSLFGLIGLLLVGIDSYLWAENQRLSNTKAKSRPSDHASPASLGSCYNLGTLGFRVSDVRVSQIGFLSKAVVSLTRDMSQTHTA